MSKRADQQPPVAATASRAVEVLVLLLELVYADVSIGDEGCRGLAEGMLGTYGDSLIWPAIRYLTKERETYAILHHNAVLRRVFRRQRREAILAEKAAKAAQKDVGHREIEQQQQNGDDTDGGHNSAMLSTSPFKSPNFRRSLQMAEEQLRGSVNSVSESRSAWQGNHNHSLMLPLTSTPFPTVPQLHVCEFLCRLRNLLTTALSLYGTRAMVLKAPDVLIHFPLALIGIREVVVGAKGSIQIEQPVIVNRLLQVLDVIERQGGYSSPRDEGDDNARDDGNASPTATFRLLKSLLGDLVEALLSTTIELASYAIEAESGLSIIDTNGDIDAFFQAEYSQLSKVIEAGGVKVHDGSALPEVEGDTAALLARLLEAVLGPEEFQQQVHPNAVPTRHDGEVTREVSSDFPITSAATVSQLSPLPKNQQSDPPTLSQPHFNVDAQVGTSNTNDIPHHSANTFPPLTPITAEIIAEKSSAAPTETQAAIASLLAKLQELKELEEGRQNISKVAPGAIYNEVQSGVTTHNDQPIEVTMAERSAVLTLADGTQHPHHTQQRKPSSVSASPTQLRMESANGAATPSKAVILTPEANIPQNEFPHPITIANPSKLARCLLELTKARKHASAAEGDSFTLPTAPLSSDSISTTMASFLAEAHARCVKGRDAVAETIEAEEAAQQGTPKRKKRRGEKRAVLASDSEHELPIASGFYYCFSMLAAGSTPQPLSAPSPSLRSLSHLLASPATGMLVAAVADIGTVKTAEAGGLALGERFTAFADAKRRWWAAFSGESIEQDTTSQNADAEEQTLSNHMIESQVPVPVEVTQVPNTNDIVDASGGNKSAKPSTRKETRGTGGRKNQKSTKAGKAAPGSAAAAVQIEEETDPFSVSSLYSQKEPTNRQATDGSTLSHLLHQVDVRHKMATEAKTLAEQRPADITDLTPSKASSSKDGRPQRSMVHNHTEQEAADEERDLASLLNLAPSSQQVAASSHTHMASAPAPQKFRLSEDGRRYIAVPPQ